MSRLPEAPPGESPSPKPSPPAQVGKAVCPFCGQPKLATAEPCPRCTMDDTPATRQATKARIGPWYVLQNRSPSAPGMKFATLIWLVNKGHVTPRSIVRGPTTYQLWRYAAHVRGLSREWGLCYSCGGSIEKTATICVHCERPQEPPSEPDVLLDVRVAHPVRHPVTAAQEVSPPAPTKPRQTIFIREPQEIEPPPPPPLTHEASHAERLRQRQKMIVRHQPDARRGVDAEIVSGMELAAALQGADAVEAHPRRANLLNVALFVVVLLGAAAAAVLYLKPEYRAPTASWIQGTWNGVRDRLSALQWSSPPGEPLPGTDRQQQPQPAPLKSAAATTEPPQATANSTTPSPADAPAPPAAAEQEPQLARDSERVSPPPDRSQSSVLDVSRSVDRAVEDARALWGQALDAEARQDFAAAVRAYEQIKQLPQSAWPGGLQVSLDLARKRAAAARAN